MFTKVDKSDFPLVFNSYQAVAPRYQKMADFCLRRFQNSDILNINEASFPSCEELKRFRDAVYGRLRGDDCVTFFGKFQEARKEFDEIAGTRRILNIWLKQRGVVLLSPKNTFDMGYFSHNFGEGVYTVKDVWRKDAAVIQENLNFATVCLLGHLEAAELLLKKDPTLAKETLTAKDSSAFDCAVWSGNMDLIRLVYEHGARPTKNSYLFAISSGDLEMLKFLIAHFPDLEVDWQSPEFFPLATLFDDVGVLKFLLSKGMSIDSVGERNETALHFACRTHLNDIVAFLLENNASTLMKSDTGKTALHVALKADNCDALSLLISHRHQELFENDSKYLSVLFYLCKQGNLPLVKVMLTHEVPTNVKDRKGKSLVHKAVKSGNALLVEFLHQKNFPIEEPDNESITPLHIACRRDDTNMVLALLKAGANVNAEDQNGCTPLFFVASMEIYKLLINHGANASHQNVDDYTFFLYQLAYNGNENTILEMLDDGVDRKLTAKDQSNAFAYALAFGYKVVSKQLQDRGASLTPAHASFALLRTIAEGVTDTTKFLLKEGADPNYIQKHRCPALMVICSRQSEEEIISILDFLFANGADINIQINDIGAVLLIRAAYFNLTNVCAYLLKRGIKIQEDRNCFALLNALCHRNVPLTNLLLGSGSLIEPESLSVNSPLVIALMYGLEDFALQFIDKGANVNKIEGNDLAPLSWACFFGYKKAVHKLVEKGAVVNLDSLLYAIRRPDQLFHRIVSQESTEFLRTSFESYSEENKEAILDFLISQLQSKDQDFGALLYEAFTNEASCNIVRRILAEKNDAHLISEEASNAMWKIVLRSGRMDLYTLLKSLPITHGCSLFEKLQFLRNPKSLPILKDILEKEGQNLLLLEDKQLELLIPYHPSLQDAFRPYDLGFFDSVRCLKKLAHSFSLGGTTTLANKEISLEGMLSDFAGEMAKTFRGFVVKQRGELLKEFSEQSIEKMVQATSPLEQKIDGATLESELMNGKVVLFASGYEEHTIGILFFIHPVTKQCHLLLENRGGGADEVGLSEIVFMPQGTLRDVFNQLNNLFDDVYDVENKQTILVHDIKTFWKILAQVGVDRDKAKLLMQQFPQQYETCVHDNIKGLMAGLFYAQAILDGHSAKESIAIMLQFYKQFAAFERNDTLRTALDVFQPETYPSHLEFDDGFFEELCERVVAMDAKKIERPLVKRLKKTIDAFAIRAIGWSKES